MGGYQVCILSQGFQAIKYWRARGALLQQNISIRPEILYDWAGDEADKVLCLPGHAIWTEHAPPSVPYASWC